MRIINKKIFNLNSKLNKKDSRRTEINKILNLNIE
jgi:hypothetical protein